MKRAPRGGRPAAVALVALIALACAVVAGWQALHAAPGAPALQARLAHAPIVRALRCARVARVRLSGPGTAWQLRYVAQRDGAAVAIELAADGRVRLYDAGGARDAPAAGAAALRLAALVDASDLLCASEVPVAGRRAPGDYRRSLEVQAPGYRRTLSADMCFQPSDVLAWREVSEALEALLAARSAGLPAPRPAGGGLLASACRDGELAQLGELDRRERELVPAPDPPN